MPQSPYFLDPERSRFNPSPIMGKPFAPVQTPVTPPEKSPVPTPAPAPTTPGNVLQSQAVRATGPNYGQAAWAQNLANFGTSGLAGGQGAVREQMNPLSMNQPMDLQTLLMQALSGAPFSWKPPQQPAFPTPQQPQRPNPIMGGVNVR
jgi:hypothetical protein